MVLQASMNAIDFGVILEGGARSYRSGLDETDAEQDSLGHGYHLGSDGLLAISRYGRSVVMETEGRVAVLGKQDFLRLVRRTPSIAMNLPGLSVLKFILPFFFDKSAFFYMLSMAIRRPVCRTYNAGGVARAALAVCGWSYAVGRVSEPRDRPLD